MRYTETERVFVMRCFVINLPLAEERRVAVEEQFQRIKLPYELWPAISGFDLPEDTWKSANHGERDRLGMRRMDRASVGCLLSHLEVLRELAKSNDDMAAVFEDDMRLHSDLPDVLDALEGKAHRFDIIKLERRYTHLRYFPIYQLLPSHSLGRVKYQDTGAGAYVITRRAAVHLLEVFPGVVHEIDWIIPRFWESGLRNILYVNPPVAFHDAILPSYIDLQRLSVHAEHSQRLRRGPAVMARRLTAAVRRQTIRWAAFRELRRQDRDIDPFGF